MIEKFNLSFILMFPMIAESDEKWSDYFGNHMDALVNGYSGDINKPWLDKHVFVKFDTSKLEVLNIGKLLKNENFERNDTVLIDDGYYDIYAMRIPEQYLAEYYIIKSNDFYNISSELKHKIMRFWEVDISSSIGSALFYKHKHDAMDRKIDKEMVDEEIYIDETFGLIVHE
jgi:hypothetical protein